MPTWILITQFASRLILLVLVLLSVWSVSIMIERRRYLRSRLSDLKLSDLKGRIATGTAPAELRKIEGHGILHGTLLAALAAPSLDAESIDRAVRSYVTEEKMKLEKGLTVLATLGSNAPFVGLLGTVLGIMQAFGELARNASGTQAVMAGISEALVATAIGLFVSIPAVAAYNYFSRQVRVLINDCDALRDFLVSRLSAQQAKR